MVSKDELKEIDIKNRTCYYFDDIDTDFSGILLDKILYKERSENILVYGISNKLQRVQNYCVLGTIK